MKKTFLFLLAAFIFCGCGESSKELVLSPSSVVLNHDGKQYVSIAGNPKDVEWKSYNEFVAGVSNGTITGRHIGTTGVKATSKDKSGSCTVQVKPLYKTFEEPCTQWGASKSTVSAQRGNIDKTSADGNTIYIKQTDDIIEMYTFKDGKLEYSMVALPQTYTTVGDFLLERYQPVTFSDMGSTFTAYFIDAMSVEENYSKIIALAVYTNPSIFGVIYFPKGYNKNNAPSAMRDMKL